MNLTNFGRWQGSVTRRRQVDEDLAAVTRGLVSVARALYHPFLILALAVIAIEAILGLRLYTQLSSRPMEGFFLSFSNHLVAPFRSLDSDPPVKSTGVFEFATLAAMNAYLILGLAGVLLGLFANGLWRVTAGLLRWARENTDLPRNSRF